MDPQRNPNQQNGQPPVEPDFYKYFGRPDEIQAQQPWSPASSDSDVPKRKLPGKVKLIIVLLVLLGATYAFTLLAPAPASKQATTAATATKAATPVSYAFPLSKTITFAKIPAWQSSLPDGWQGTADTMVGYVQYMQANRTSNTGMSYLLAIIAQPDTSGTDMSRTEAAVKQYLDPLPNLVTNYKLTYSGSAPVATTAKTNVEFARRDVSYDSKGTAYRSRLLYRSSAGYAMMVAYGGPADSFSDKEWDSLIKTSTMEVNAQ